MKDALTFGNPVGLWTLTKREMVRTFHVINQVIWPPIITTLLYIFVFGLALGSRIKTVGNVPYAEFLIPGLIMLQIIDGTYSETSSSVFQGRFMNSIQELLVSPLSAIEMVSGYVLSAILRALLIAGLILAVGVVFVHTWPRDWFLFVAVTILVAALFAGLGIIFGLIAEKFDHIAILTTFAITPLVFVGGVFTSVRFLPEPFRSISYANPMFYMIDALRHAFTGQGDAPLWVSVGVVAAMTVLAVGSALRMMAVGYKLRL
ncbi:MAG: ABC transporter permease [Candidatus Baltobacteraceae bacterium]